MPPSTKKEAATLTRVRDNQRRCRARKREYVAELEKKIQDMQTATARASAQNPNNVVKRLEAENHRLQQYVFQLERKRQDQQAAATLAEMENQNTIQRLKDENGELREMLARADFGEVQILAGLEKSGDLELRDHGNTADGQPLPPPVQNELVSMPEPLISSTSTSLEDLLSVPFLNPLVGLFDTIDSNYDNLDDDTARTVDRASDCCPSNLTSDCGQGWPSIVDSLTPRQYWPSSMGSSNSDSDTTLCSVAYELVRQHNNIGLDMIEIGIRLWNGFRKGSKDGEGCKVENKLLFSVLEYISG